jgi:hypothetical protein
MTALAEKIYNGVLALPTDEQLSLFGETVSLRSDLHPVG